MPRANENRRYVTAEYLKKRARDEDAVNQESYRMLQIQKGNSVLELGCGPCTATSVFYKAAGPEGSVIDLDYDSKMIQQARTTTKNYPNVLMLAGDAHKLPFENETFDRVYAKRLFQVLPQNSAPIMFSELQRVLKPGGIFVLVDTDWTSVSVNYSDLELERRLTAFFRDHMRPNGLAGRQLLAMTQQGGFVNVAAKVMSIVIRDFDETPFNEWLAAEALKAKVATPGEMENWCRELSTKSNQHAFLFHVGTVLVSAQKRAK
jgi:ubiquinone/menaquinone biosynthesis C-methylase UbiE